MTLIQQLFSHISSLLLFLISVYNTRVSILSRWPLCLRSFPLALTLSSCEHLPLVITEADKVTRPLLLRLKELSIRGAEEGKG